MTGNYRALLIGVYDYAADSGFSRLKGPRNDVHALYRVLRDPTVGLFTVKEPLFNPSTGQLRINVEKFLDTADHDDNLLIYYSGHGEISRKNQRLCLTSAEGDLDALDGSSLAFDELFEWIIDSPARSVTVILDCCRSGVSLKGGVPDLARYFEATEDAQPRQKMVCVVTAAAGYESVPDAESEGELSPFTARLVTALTESAAANDMGLVSIAQVIAAMNDVPGDTRRFAHAWGTYNDDGPYLARRADHARHALKEAGLKHMELRRAGAAHYHGRTVHIPVHQVDQIVGRLQSGHPTSAFVSGPVGSGKTWILSDVADRLTTQGWRVQSFSPSRELDDAQALLAALHRFCVQFGAAAKSPAVVIIDGIEWSDAWAEFVAGLHQMTEQANCNVSVLASLEIQRGQVQPDHYHKAWDPGGGIIIQSVTGGNATEFIAEVLSPRHNPDVADWDPDRLERARTALQEQVGTDLWAAAHLGPLWHDPDVEARVIRAVWEERIGEVTPQQVTALQTVAALSRFNLWCPLALAAPAGDALVRLGAEYSAKNDAVRLHSGFLNRAILARTEKDGAVTYVVDRHMADPTARRILAGHLRDALLDRHRQQEVVTTLNRLRYDRRVFRYVVSRLSYSTRRQPSAWDRWAEDCWTDLSSIVQILSLVRTALSPGQAADLGRRFCQEVIDHPSEQITFPTAVGGLELLQSLHRGRPRSAVLTEAQQRLLDIAERELVAHRWPAGLRRRLLRVLRQMNRLNEATIDRFGPLLLRPSSPPSVADVALVFDFTRIVCPGRATDTVRAVVAGWDVVSTDLVQLPEESDAESRVEQLAARTILARHIFDERTAARLDSRLAIELRTATAAQLARMLFTCTRMDRKFTAEIAGMLEVDRWSTTIFRRTSPLGVAQLVGALGRIRPDLAVRALYRVDGRVDSALAESLAQVMRAEGDAVSASLLLKTAAKLEEQRGMLYGGFAQQLATALGLEFLTDTLAHNNRLTIVNHVIEGFVAARAPELEPVREDVLRIVETQIEHSSSENGPRLALMMSAPDVLGESFLAALRARGTVRRSTVLARMLSTYNPGALTAHHELGVILFPGVENEFVDEVEASGTTWTETRMFDNLAGEGNVVAALRAARAVTATLALAGRQTGDSVVLEAYRRAYATDYPGREWTTRVFDADDVELAEALRLLHTLSPRRALEVVERGGLRLLHAARRSPPRVFADLLAAVCELSTEAGERLVERCLAEGLVEAALDDLEFDGDLFDQAAALGSLADVENRLCQRVIPEEIAERFRASWVDQVPVISHPALLQGLVWIAGNWGRDSALAVAQRLNISSLARRLDHRNVADATGFAQLVTVLGELTPHVLSSLVHEENARWLLWTAPMNLVARTAEVMIRTGVITPSEAQTVLSLRVNYLPDEVPIRHLDRHWVGVGWAAWVAARYGARLHLNEPMDQRVLAALPSPYLLWVLTWFEPRPWMRELMERAYRDINAQSAPPESPAAAAAVLAAYTASGMHPPRYDHDGLHAWQHVLLAEPGWVRAVLSAAQPGGAVHRAVLRDWAPWGVQQLRVRLAWMAHDWREVPLEALSALTTLASTSARKRPAERRASTQRSPWQRAE